VNELDADLVSRGTARDEERDDCTESKGGVLACLHGVEATPIAAHEREVAFVDSTWLTHIGPNLTGSK
jgi:hypothetical protein